VGEAGALAPIPDVARRTRWPGLCARGTLVPDARPTSPSINDAGAGDGRGATGAAATGSGRRTNAGESRDDQSRDEEPSHDVDPFKLIVSDLLLSAVSPGNLELTRGQRLWFPVCVSCRRTRRGGDGMRLATAKSRC
jgi:hypothetical protein